MKIEQQLEKKELGSSLESVFASRVSSVVISVNPDLATQIIVILASSLQSQKPESNTVGSDVEMINCILASLETRWSVE